MSNNQPPITKEGKIILCITIFGLPLIASLLIWKISWLFAGHVFFGLTIGLMVGMTKSSVVSTALPLLFTFAGGSVVSLSIGTSNRAPHQIDTLGIQLAGFGIGTTIGLLVGVILGKLAVQLPLGKFKD